MRPEIAALVRTIQTDTQDAVGLVERSTQGCGGRLDCLTRPVRAGDIDRVSRRLAELIEQISSRPRRSRICERGGVQHPAHFAVTEQTEKVPVRQPNWFVSCPRPLKNSNNRCRFKIEVLTCVDPWTAFKTHPVR